MAKLRKKFHTMVRESLDSSIYTADDFNIMFGDTEKKEKLIAIYFSYSEEFYFSVKTNTPSPTLSLEMSPGKVHERDFIACNDIDSALKYIPNWCAFIREELKASNITYKEIELLKEKINSLISGNNDNSEYTNDEITILKQKFEQLEKRIKTLEEEKQITPEQSKNFNEGLEQVSEDLTHYPKATWMKTATNKIAKLFTALGTSPEGRKLLSDGARKILQLD